MGRGAANPQILDGRAVVGIARHGPVEQKLVKGQLALEDVAFREAHLCLKLARCAHLHMQHEVLEARREPFDLVKAGLAEGVSVGIGPVASVDLGRGILHEADMKCLPGGVIVGSIMVGIMVSWNGSRLKRPAFQSS